MNNKNSAPAFFFFSFIFIGSILFFGCVQQPPSAPFANASVQIVDASAQGSQARESELLFVNVGADFGNGTVISKAVLVDKGSSALVAFENAFSVSKKEFAPYGAYVYSVGGVEENANGSNRYWQYYVDGVLAPIGVSQFFLEKNSSLLFRLEASKLG